MNRPAQFEAVTQSAAETQAIAARLARLLRGGEVIELISDLGGGKTTFVQGLAMGLGYGDRVTSPTFALSNRYMLPNGLELHHYDLYRLSHGGVVGQELAEQQGANDVVVVIEWAGAVQAGLPTDRLCVTLKHLSGDARQLIFEAGGPRSERLVRELAGNAVGDAAGGAADGPAGGTASESPRGTVQ